MLCHLGRAKCFTEVLKRRKGRFCWYAFAGCWRPGPTMNWGVPVLASVRIKFLWMLLSIYLCIYYIIIYNYNLYKNIYITFLYKIKKSIYKFYARLWFLGDRWHLLGQQRRYSVSIKKPGTSTRNLVWMLWFKEWKKCGWH